MSPSDLRHALDELARDADSHQPADRLARVHRQARQAARTRAVAGAAAAVVVVLGGTWALHAAWSPEAGRPATPGSSTRLPTAPPTSAAPAPTAHPTPSTAPTAATSRTPTTASSGPALVDSTCAPDHLAVVLGTAGGTAGSTYVPIVLTNQGKTACVLQGYPAVGLTATAGGPVIGPEAVDDHAYPQGEVRLAPGGHASALVRIVDALNYPPASCASQRVAFLKVTPPGRRSQTTYVALPSSTLACTTPIQQLVVRPVVAGQQGQ
jgi:hypothetical protein